MASEAAGFASGRDPPRRAVAADVHRGQVRATGDPYIVHPIAVAEILAGYGMDGSTIAAALLHDTVEDTELTLDDAKERFGAEVALLIDGVTKLDRIKFSSRELAQAATIRKMAVAMAKDSAAWRVAGRFEWRVRARSIVRIIRRVGSSRAGPARAGWGVISRAIRLGARTPAQTNSRARSSKSHCAV